MASCCLYLACGLFDAVMARNIGESGGAPDNPLSYLSLSPSSGQVNLITGFRDIGKVGEGELRMRWCCFLARAANHCIMLARYRQIRDGFVAVARLVHSSMPTNVRGS